MLTLSLGSLALAACTRAGTGGSSENATDEVTASGKATKTPSLNLTRVSADLKPLATAIYTGGAVPATKGAATAVKAFKVPASPAPVVTTKATWKGTPIAVLTSGKDATFAVRTGGEWQVVGGWWPSLGVAAPSLGGKQFVLFMGSDARTQKGQKLIRSNADALQVVGVDGKGGAGVMGMARDLWVPIAGGGRGKINSGLARGGPAAQAKTIRNATGLPVQAYVLTGFNDFIWMINAMGKITIDSTVAVRTQDGLVPKGKSVVSGLKALWYSRERHHLPNGDFGRSFNQGTVLLGIAALARSKGPSKLVNVLGQASDHVITNLTAEQALLFGAWVYKVNPAKVGHRVAKGPVGTSPGGSSIVVLGPEARSTFAAFRDGSLPVS